MPQAQNRVADAIPMEGEVWRDGSERGKAVAGAGRGEPGVEAHGGRTASGQARIAGGGCKKMVSPQLRREAVVVMRSEVVVSERRACGLIEIDRRTYRYAPRPEDPRLRVRLRELAAERRRF